MQFSPALIYHIHPNPKTGYENLILRLSPPYNFQLETHSTMGQSWRISIEDKDGKSSPSRQRKWGLVQMIHGAVLQISEEQADPIGERMGDIPSDQQHPEPRFRKISVDMAGPYLMKANGREKIWIAVFTCSISSAIKLYLCRDYSEEEFLQAWRHHMCDWGHPSLVYSDRGTQLVSAAGGLDPKDKEDTVDWGKVGKKTGVKWIFTPAQSQRRNGRAEALVKDTKHSLKTTFKNVDMNFIDFYTTLKEISNMLNSRPIELLRGEHSKSGGAKEIDSNLPDSWTAITPNDLLIGDGQTGSLKSSYTETRPVRLADIENKVSKWHKN